MYRAAATRDMSPSELAKCRENLKRRWENRQVDKALLQRAWETAHRVATTLYQDFGAAKVAIFGSLAENRWFTKESDIDIAVWGLSDRQCCDARYGIGDLCPEFKIDLINFEEATGLFRDRVRRQAIPLEKGPKQTAGHAPYEYLHTPIIPERHGTIYEMNQNQLIQRIAAERVKVERVIGSITELLEEIEVAVPRHRKFFEELTAKKLVEVYSGFERIFERIAREVDMQTPRGSRWHNDLLEQMAERRPERPPVISEKTLLKLKGLLDFRHKINNIYSDELIYENVGEHANPIRTLFATVSKELDAFVTFLAEI